MYFCKATNSARSSENSIFSDLKVSTSLVYLLFEVNYCCLKKNMLSKLILYPITQLCFPSFCCITKQSSSKPNRTMYDLQKNAGWWFLFFKSDQQHYKTLSCSVRRCNLSDRHHCCIGLPELPLHRAAGCHLRAVCLPLIPH